MSLALLFCLPGLKLATILLSLALASPTVSGKKPKQPKPQYFQCKGAVCIAGLKWQNEYTGFHFTGYHLEGTFQNNSTVTLSDVTLDFDVYSGRNIAANSSARIQAVPSGGSWFFVVRMDPLEGNRLISSVRPARIRFWVQRQVITDTLEFAPICNPNLHMKSCE